MNTEAGPMGALPGTYLTFGLGGGIFGFEAHSLWEISTTAFSAPLPRFVPFLVGITHLHGKIVPVMDLAGILGMPPREREEAQGLVAVKPPGWNAPTGFYARSILGFERFQDSEIQTVPASEGNPFRKGRVVTTERTVELIDLAPLLEGLKKNLTGVHPPQPITKGEQNV